MERYQRYSAICLKLIHKIHPLVYFWARKKQNTDIRYESPPEPPPVHRHQMTPPMTPSVTDLSANPWPLYTQHPVWRQPSIGSANPQPYAHQKMTPPTTPCVTAWSWICEPAAVRASEDDTSNDTLCDSLPQGPPACVTAPPTPPRNEATKFCEPSPPNLK